MKKNLLIGATLITAAGAGLGTGLSSLTAAHAAPPAGHKTNHTTIVSKIAADLHLNKSEVRNVLKAYRQDKKATSQAKLKAKLDASVKAGTLSAAQEQQLLAKLQALHATATAKGQTKAEKRSALQAARQQISAWAAQNNIPLSKILPHFTANPHKLRT